MEALIDSIRIALQDGATDDERRRAAESCRALANTLEPPPVVPAADASPTVALTVAPCVAPIATVPATATGPLAPGHVSLWQHHIAAPIAARLCTQFVSATA